MHVSLNWLKSIGNRKRCRVLHSQWFWYSRDVSVLAPHVMAWHEHTYIWSPTAAGSEQIRAKAFLTFYFLFRNPAENRAVRVPVHHRLNTVSIFLIWAVCPKFLRGKPWVFFRSKWKWSIKTDTNSTFSITNITLMYAQTDIRLNRNWFVIQDLHNPAMTTFWLNIRIWHVRSICTTEPHISDGCFLTLCSLVLVLFGFFLSTLYLCPASAEKTPCRSSGYQALINASRKHTD